MVVIKIISIGAVVGIALVLFNEMAGKYQKIIRMRSKIFLLYLIYVPVKIFSSAEYK